MLLALCILTLCLSMAACPQWLAPTPVLLAGVEPDVGVGIGTTSRPRDALPVMSVASGGGNGGASSTAAFPPGWL